MKGEILFEKMTGISDEYVMEAALVAPVTAESGKKRRVASLSTAWRRGLSAACICLIVAITAVGGLVAWERMGEAVGPGSDPSVRFAFSYEMTDNNGSAWSGTAMPGDMVNVRTTIVNHGKPFKSYGFRAHAQFVLQEDDSIIIEGVYPLIDAPKETIETNRVGTCFFSFQIPENATPGVYDLVLSFDGEKQVFGGALTVGEVDTEGETYPPIDTTDHPFSFGYETGEDAVPGTFYHMNTWVINEGASFTFEGSSMGFAPSAVLIHMETQYRIEGNFDVTTDFRQVTVNTGDKGQVMQEFMIPTDAPTGAYTLVLSYDGATQSFADVVTINDTPASSFSFGYEPFGGFAIPGDFVRIEAWVINDGEPFTYIGNSYKETGRFYPTVTLYHQETGYTIKVLPPETAIEPILYTVETGEKGKNTYARMIPTDAPTGEYGLVLSYGDVSKRFEGVLTVAEPTVEAPAVLSNLTVAVGKDWLYEPIDEAYVPGELVTVRFKFATDVGTLFFLNGEVITTEVGDDRLGYWEYSFYMPDRDSGIMFQTYDCMAPYSGMLEACIRADPYLFDEEEFYYYGEFGDGVMVGLQLWRDEAIGSTAVGGYTFVTATTHDMMAFHNGTLYELRTAYDMGLLTDEHLEAMLDTHKEWFPYN